MKRCFSLICTIFLMVSVIIPVSAVVPSADQVPIQKDYSVGEIRALGAKAFPEYAERITSTPSLSVYQTLNTRPSDPVVISETRDISEELSVNYTEFASGLSLTTVLTPRTTVVSNTSNGTLRMKTINFYIVPNFGNTKATWKDFKCVIAYNDYDNITSVGYNPYPNSASYSMNMTTAHYAENSTAAAYAKYSGILQVYYDTDDFKESVRFTATASVRNDNFTFTVNRVV